MQHLKSFLSNIHPVDELILDEYIGHWNAFEIQKKQTITVAGETEKYLYFVLSGIQKSYYLHEHRAHIITFAYAPSFSGVIESFFNQKPSRYYLESITASKFIRISYQKHQQFLTKHRAIETLFRKITESFLDGVIQRQHEIMALSMEDRFNVFVKRSPHLLQMISQKDLASYLRIDATNFSKLINKIRI